jgi:hypothetical protein
MRAFTCLLLLSLLGLMAAPASTQAQPAAYARAGHTLTLGTRAHGVSGKATIIDERTVVLSNFNYDAGGPMVYAYLGTADSQSAFESGIAIGGRLNNRLTPYVNEVVTLTLPAGQTLDGYGALSIWCREFNANFGSGAFAAPPATGTPPPTATPKPNATQPPTNTPQPGMTPPAPTVTASNTRLFLPAITR